MSVKVMSLVWDHFPEGGGSLVLALALADWSSQDGTGIWPSVSQMANKARLSERQVHYILAGMKRIGWLVQVAPGGFIDGENRATTYRIPIERIPKDAQGVVQLLHPVQVAGGAIDDTDGVQFDPNMGCNPLHPNRHVNPTVSKPTVKAQRFALPPWVDAEAWKGFEAMRIKTRKPMTDRARAMIVAELEKLRQQGEEPTAVLAQSEVRCWASVYPIGSQADKRKSLLERSLERTKNWKPPEDEDYAQQ